MLGEIVFVVFGRSNIKYEIWILQYIPRKHVKYLARAREVTLQKFCCEISGYAHLSFPQNFKFLYSNKFLSYRNASYMKKRSMFDEKFDEIKFKWFA